MKLVLASSSPARKQLLKQINIIPDMIFSPDVDETPFKGEKARELTKRLAQKKLEASALKIAEKSIVICADSSAEQGAKIVGKAESAEDVAKKMRWLSGKKHRLYTSVAIGIIENGKILKHALKTSKTTLTFKKLSEKEIKNYISMNQGIGCEAGLTVEGYAACFIKTIEGSHSGVMGLPLYETMNLLTSLGFIK